MLKRENKRRKNDKPWCVLIICKLRKSQFTKRMCNSFFFRNLDLLFSLALDPYATVYECVCAMIIMKRISDDQTFVHNCLHFRRGNSVFAANTTLRTGVVSEISKPKMVFCHSDGITRSDVGKFTHTIGHISTMCLFYELNRHLFGHRRQTIFQMVRIVKPHVMVISQNTI